jgi:hypothetical protein
MTAEDEALATLTREVAEHHVEWDVLHALYVIHRDAAGIAARTIVGIDPAMPPDLYPVLIEAMVKERAAEDGPPYALLLEMEMFGVLDLPEDAPAWQRAQLEADRVNRTLHQRADAVEAAWVHAADVHGRVWAACRERGKDGVEEAVYEPGSDKIGGQMVKAMLDALRLYGSEYVT